jgi:outer membrane protein assembly factor BamE (lipoprotein component of BamABCDE complex)
VEISAQNTTNNKTILYPYYASENRVEQIKNNYRKVKSGMTPEQVKSLLGEPDETHPLYEPKILNPKQIGNTHWFIIQRKTAKGSVKDKDEKLVRISYDLNWKVIGIDHWGFDDKNR